MPDVFRRKGLGAIPALGQFQEALRRFFLQVRGPDSQTEALSL